MAHGPLVFFVCVFSLGLRGRKHLCCYNGFYLFSVYSRSFFSIIQAIGEEGVYLVRPEATGTGKVSIYIHAGYVVL